MAKKNELIEDIENYNISYIYDKKTQDILNQLEKLRNWRGEFLHSIGQPANTDSYYNYFNSEISRIMSLAIPVKMVFTNKIKNI